MILLTLIVVLLTGGILAWIVARRNGTAARWIAMATVGFNLAATVGLWIGSARRTQVVLPRWLEQISLDWIPQFGIRFHLAIDGLSLAMLLLTYFLGLMAILCSWTEIRARPGFFHFN